MQQLIAQVAPAPKDTLATRVQVLGVDCALFPAGIALDSWFGDALANSCRFTPTRAHAAEAEQGLPRVQLEQAYQYPVPAYYAHYPASIKQQLAVYQRQYFGFYNALGQPCLFINFFIETKEYAPGTIPGWLKRPIQTADGGPAYWQIYYNLATHSFYNFSHGLEG